MAIKYAYTQKIEVTNNAKDHHLTYAANSNQKQWCKEQYFFSFVLVFFKLDSCSHEQYHYKLQLCSQILCYWTRKKMVENCFGYPCNVYLLIDNHKIVYEYAASSLCYKQL